MARVRARILIAGRVQGVYFRATLHRVATAAGVTGWVRNRPDGRVEAVAEGEEAAVRQVIDWCHEGPRGAQVEDVTVEWSEPEGQFERFSVAHGSERP